MGLLLGVALHEGTSFPVGKVDFLNLYPLNFREFLMAVGQEQLKELLNTDLSITDIALTSRDVRGLSLLLRIAFIKG